MSWLASFVKFIQDWKLTLQVLKGCVSCFSNVCHLIIKTTVAKKLLEDLSINNITISDFRFSLVITLAKGRVANGGEYHFRSKMQKELHEKRHRSVTKREEREKKSDHSNKHRRKTTVREKFFSSFTYHQMDERMKKKDMKGWRFLHSICR